MKSKEYVLEVLKTESIGLDQIKARMASDDLVRLLHASQGLCTESGELTDALKKHIFYGKELDKVNLVEELGDIFWYAAVAADVLGVGFDEIWEKNINKLRKRYGEKFSEERAINRNLNNERKELE